MERATAGRRGEARLYLIGRDSGEEDVTLYFGYQLSGADVVVRQEGYAAKVSAMRDKGLLCLTAGHSTIRLLPPLTISQAEIDEGLSIMASVLGA